MAKSVVKKVQCVDLTVSNLEFGSSKDPDVRPSVIASPELPTCKIPISEVPKYIHTHGFGVSAFRCPGLSREIR
jgi:hypothetical protein